MRMCLTFFLILLTSCWEYEGPPYAVSPYGYVLEQKCWFDSKKKFSSFLLVKKIDNDKFTATPFSSFCYIKGFNNTDITLDYINSIYLYDNNKLLENIIKDGRKFVSNTFVIDSINNDRDEDFEIYTFRGDVSLDNIEGITNNTIYSIDRIYYIKPLGVKFNEFIKYSAKHRLEIYNRNI